MEMSVQAIGYSQFSGELEFDCARHVQFVYEPVVKLHLVSLERTSS